MSTLAKTGCGKNSATFRQIFTSQFFPDATREQADWWNELQKKSASAENAHRSMLLFGEINVGNLLPEVRAPSMVMHCRDDQLIPFEAGRQMAARIPGAEFTRSTAAITFRLPPIPPGLIFSRSFGISWPAPTEVPRVSTLERARGSQRSRAPVAPGPRTKRAQR